MEYHHIHQVLYRDQRTIKTRYHHPYEEEDCAIGHQTCPSNYCYCCERMRFRPTQGVPNNNSSLNSNCHNQYCSKLKRLLYQTEVRCGCEGVRDVSQVSQITQTDSKKKRVRGKSWWLKKFPTVLLLGTYLSLITIPYVSAVPTTISSRPTAFWNSRQVRSVPKESLKSKMNITSLTPAYRSAQAAYDRAADLKTKFRNRLGSDPEVIYKDVPAYDWLPQLPSVSSASFGDHLKLLELQQAVLDIHTYIRTIRVPVEQLEVDFNREDCVWGANFSSMRGALDNIIEDLDATISDNKLMVTVTVTNDTMPTNLRKLNQTDRALRDWLIIRVLVDVLDYTVAVFRHFQIPYSC